MVRKHNAGKLRNYRMANTPVSVPERLLRNIERLPWSGCWIWLGDTIPSGYGVMRSSDYRKREYAHRLAWTSWKGEIPNGLFVCHKCDVKSCINPEHLFVGTQKENMQDWVDKWLAPFGERSHLSKLTDSQVRSIREDSRTQDEIAASYGVSQTCISKIKLRSRWRHLA